MEERDALGDVPGRGARTAVRACRGADGDPRRRMDGMLMPVGAIVEVARLP